MTVFIIDSQFCLIVKWIMEWSIKLYQQQGDRKYRDCPAFQPNLVAHRDLKPPNILVSNQHYCSLSDEDDILRQFQSRPIACKLTDFGESRSLLVQTQSLLASKTNDVDRGTVVYMAPETLVDQMKISGATITDLFLVDVWALGMIFFSMINPSLKHPFLLEMRSARQKKYFPR